MDVSDGSEDFFILGSPPYSLKLLLALLDRYVDEETTLHLILTIIDHSGLVAETDSNHF